MLGHPLDDGLYNMAWTVFACWCLFLDFAGVLMSWNRNDMYLTSGVVGVARVRCSFKSGVGQLKPS